MSARLRLVIRCVFAVLLVLAVIAAACPPERVYFGHRPGEPWGIAVLDDSPAFLPLWLDLPAGSTVIWWNQAARPAIVHSGTAEHPTPAFVFWIAPASRVSYTFVRPGTYEFFSTFRPDQPGRAVIR